MANQWSMLTADPVVMRCNLPGATSEAYGAYLYDYAVE